MKSKIMPVLLATLYLTACEAMPRLPQMTMRGPDFRPLGDDIARMAAPGNRTSGGATLFCSIAGGSAHAGKSWQELKETAFALQANTKTRVPLKIAGGALALQGYFDTEGQKIVFCPVVDAPPDARIACASIYALEDDLDLGIKRTFDVPDAVTGGSIACARDPAKLKKL